MNYSPMLNHSQKMFERFHKVMMLFLQRASFCLIWLSILANTIVHTQRLLAIQFYEAPDSITQNQIESLNNAMVKENDLLRNCSSDAFLIKSTRLSETPYNTLTLLSGRFIGIAVAKRREPEIVQLSKSKTIQVTLRATFPMNSSQFNKVNNVFRHSNISSVKISAVSAKNETINKDICKVGLLQMLGLPFCKQLLEYRELWKSSAKHSSLNSSCSLSSGDMSKLLRISSGNKTASEVSGLLSSFFPTIKQKSTYAVEEAVGTMESVSANLEGNRNLVNVTASLEAWSAGFPESLLNEMSNSNSKSSGFVAFRFTFTPVKRPPTVPSPLAQNAYFSTETVEGLMNLILASIIGFNIFVILLAIVFRVCLRSRRAFDTRIWESVFRS